ncbi:MAG: hypothetical protein KME21_21265 [Desmonostoc vinosum HA7617-LM4]|jgi:hypothetical protein|nr:hypothetical protein [Desmonostoc vinosum HA7617-LM4]
MKKQQLLNLMYLPLFISGAFSAYWVNGVDIKQVLAAQKNVHLETSKVQLLAQVSSSKDYEYESSGLIASVLYRSLHYFYQFMSPSGAYKANVRWESNETPNWYIEEQRYGEDLIIGGIVKNNSEAIKTGFKLFEWGFARQSSDGSFSMTNDRFHSTSLFVQAVAHTLLFVQQSPYSKQYAKEVAKYKPLVHRAARWMISADVWRKGNIYNKPFTHRRYLVAAALGLTGKLTNDQQLISYARKSIEDGLSSQTADGVNPERGGFDTSYQVVGVVYAQRWVTYFPNDSLTPKVVAMINKALTWEHSRVLPSGEISNEGNTRTAGQESARSGKTKAVAYNTVVRAFAYWGSATGNQKWNAIALKIAKYYYKGV